MRCAKCGTENPAGKKFCGECGNAFSMRCPKCGAENMPPSKFCGDCGTSLSQPVASLAAVSEPARTSPESAPAGERRQLTVVFCDLVGSTPLSERFDAEDFHDVIAQYQQTASRVVASFGGYVAKNLGDGLLIYFG